ncbi:hypothetical protein BH18ACT9_BH18ACT9_00510 [soil metagenome]
MAETPIGPGTLLARRFELEDLLDESEGARFYRATDRVLARDVGVHVVSADDARSEALLLAARTSATVSDVHLLRVLDAATEDGITYVVNEWGSGSSLDKLLSAGPLSPRRAAWVAKEAAEAVAAAHRHGIAHGRLIPENVVITDAGSVKLVGFVVDAVLRGRENRPLSNGLPIGEHEADVSNLGALLYAGLVARWPGTAGCQLPPAPTDNGRILRPRQVRAGVPRPLDAICERVLNADSSSQVMPIETAHEVCAALSDYIGDPTAAVPTGLGPEPGWGGARGPGDLRTADSPDEPEATQAGTPVFYDTDTGVGWMHDPAGRGVRADATTGVGTPPPLPPPPFAEPEERPLFAPDGPRRPQIEEDAAVNATGRGSSLAAPSAAGASRSASGLPSTWGPDADSPVSDTGELETGNWGSDKPGRRWLRLALALAGVLVLVVATVLALDLGRTPARPPDNAVEPSESTSSPAANPTPVEIASVSDFDPEAFPPEENPDLAPLAADQDPQTAWRTVTYFDPLEDQKEGVGLLVDLGSRIEVSEVALTFIGEPTQVELLAADGSTEAPTTTDGLTRVARREEAGTRALLELDEPTATQFLVVWLTSLPVVEDGFQGQVAEIVVRS